MKDNIITVDFENANPEISLWKAVVLQAFIDMQTNSKKKVIQAYKIKAMQWVNLKNADFIEVCRRANLDPYYVWTQAQKIKNKDTKYLNLMIS